MVCTYQPLKINAGKTLQHIRQRGTVKKQVIYTKVDKNGDLHKHKHSVLDNNIGSITIKRRNRYKIQVLTDHYYYSSLKSVIVKNQK